MSTNAGTWFYEQPEQTPFNVTERLNGTFWQARTVDIYWRCTRAETPFHAEGHMGDQLLALDWTPNEWLRLTAPAGLDTKSLVKAISKKVLAIPANLTYTDRDGNQITEWHRDGGVKRWKEVQGKAEFAKARRL